MNEAMATKIHAKHILVKSEQEANEILFDLQRGKDFDAIAAEKSLCPSGKKGGDLGWFGRGQMVKEFERRRNLIHERLNKINGIFAVNPKGAFYIFANVTKACEKLGLKNSLEFQNYVLEKGECRDSCAKLFRA
jgi:hypothetical protein